MTNTTTTTVLTTREFEAVESYCIGASNSRELRDWIGQDRGLDLGPWTSEDIVLCIESALHHHGDCAGQRPALKRALRKAERVLGEEIRREAQEAQEAQDQEATLPYMILVSLANATAHGAYGSLTIAGDTVQERKAEAERRITRACEGMGFPVLPSLTEYRRELGSWA